MRNPEIFQDPLNRGRARWSGPFFQNKIILMSKNLLWHDFLIHTQYSCQIKCLQMHDRKGTLFLHDLLFYKNSSFSFLVLPSTSTSSFPISFLHLSSPFCPQLTTLTAAMLYRRPRPAANASHLAKAVAGNKYSDVTLTPHDGRWR